MKLSNLVVSKLIWSWMVVSLLECSVWTFLKPSILSRMIWKASGGIDEDKALLLLPQLLEVDGWPSASVSVSIGSPCARSTSSSSLGRRILILLILIALIAGREGMRLISWGVSTPFAWRILMIRLGKISFALEDVLVSSAMMLNA